MRKTIFSVPALAATAILWSAPMRSDEQMLIKMEKEWAHSMATGDPSVADRLESPDIINTMPDGTISTKPQDVEDIRSRKLTTAAIDLDDFRVHMYGDHTAVVAYRCTMKGAKYAGVDISGQFRFTDTWFHSNNKWMVVATHGTPIAAPQK